MYALRSRTARGYNTGNALSLVTSSDDKTIAAVEERLSPNSGDIANLSRSISKDSVVAFDIYINSS